MGQTTEVSLEEVVVVKEVAPAPSKPPIMAEAKLVSTASAVTIQEAAEPDITFDDFKRVKLVAGTVLSADRVTGSDKLVKLSVDLGEPAPRQVLAGIGKTFPTASDLIGKQFVFVSNLAPKTMMGLESRGMLLATGAADKLSLVQVTDRVFNGSVLG